jgi:hypothetical protein
MVFDKLFELCLLRFGQVQALCQPAAQQPAAATFAVLTTHSAVLLAAILIRLWRGGLRQRKRRRQRDRQQPGDS